jgi:hypothetical protein
MAAVGEPVKGRSREPLTVEHLGPSLEREILAPDDRDRARLTDPRARIGISRSAVIAVIQNVHHSRDSRGKSRVQISRE